MEIEKEEVKHTLNAATIILGFTGPLGSGCTFIAKYLSQFYNYGYFKLSDVIRELLSADEKPTVKRMQDKGNELRQIHGNSFLVEKTLEKMQQCLEENTASEKQKLTAKKDIEKKEIIFIIDGIKNEWEVRTLRQFPNFFLFSVHADKEVRSNRLTKNKIFSSKEEFEIADKRDQEEESFTFGQQVKKCDYLSDIILLNNEHITKANTRKIDDFIGKIKHHYLKPIEAYAKKKKVTLERPTVEELCMTMAYTVSKMSSCLKRKVGAVVSIENRALKESIKKDNNGEHLRMPVIVSNGYNDVPLGLYSCLHSEFEMCYRDHLQEEHSRKIKFCPKCGAKISFEKIKCKLNTCNNKISEYTKSCNNCGEEINWNDFSCIGEGCNSKIFEDFLPGAKNSPGKLLDMCRALHAEEVALLNLARNNIINKELILYTTTQPCNLCANKIVNVGIKKVVFSEPYTMKEAKDTLEKGGVEVVRFQGIKSSAFFKLYQ